MAKRGLPETLRMRHDEHYVDALATGGVHEALANVTDELGRPGRHTWQKLGLVVAWAVAVASTVEAGARPFRVKPAEPSMIDDVGASFVRAMLISMRRLS